MTNSGAHIVLSLLIKGKLSITKSDAFAVKKISCKKIPGHRPYKKQRGKKPHPKL
jgi:hypothetical protein